MTRAQDEQTLERLNNLEEFPITIDQKCLTCNSGGQDLGHMLRIFKVACLSYVPGDVIYRNHTMTRGTLIQLRRELLDRIIVALPESKLFSEKTYYPRRYFDDLVSS